MDAGARCFQGARFQLLTAESGVWPAWFRVGKKIEIARLQFPSHQIPESLSILFAAPKFGEQLTHETFRSALCVRYLRVECRSRPGREHLFNGHALGH